MKTDKELLELAAKAAGLSVVAHGVLICGAVYLVIETASPQIVITWSPLTDDSDAFRLAVKLNISFLIDGHAKKIESSYKESDCTTCFYEEYFNFDSLAATRRAIVRAAAAIGESK